MSSGLTYRSPSDHERKLAAWQKASIIPGRPQHEWRIDCDGRTVSWREYGRNSMYGWHIDHIIPQALNGPDELWNLRARHWMGNTKAGGNLGNALAQTGGTHNALANALQATNDLERFRKP